MKSKTGKPSKQYYIKSDDKHYIWVKWIDPFADKPQVYWSAEPQGNFSEVKSLRSFSVSKSLKYYFREFHLARTERYNSSEA